tara:strand:+ start:14790 stop:14906 length:117 start_codon:yes stop_codon:yes gene_type:complete
MKTIKGATCAMVLYLEEVFGKEVPWKWNMAAYLRAKFC